MNDVCNSILACLEVIGLSVGHEMNQLIHKIKLILINKLLLLFLLNHLLFPLVCFSLCLSLFLSLSLSVSVSLSVSLSLSVSV